MSVLASALNHARSTPGHSIAAVGAIKSSPGQSVVHGKGPDCPFENMTNSRRPMIEEWVGAEKGSYEHTMVRARAGYYMDAFGPRGRARRPAHRSPSCVPCASCTCAVVRRALLHQGRVSTHAHGSAQHCAANPQPRRVASRSMSVAVITRQFAGGLQQHTATVIIAPRHDIVWRQ